MAQLFKGHIVDDGQYPMPAGSRPRTPLDGRGGEGGQPIVEVDEVARVQAELQQVFQMVGGLRPAIAQATDALRSSAQQQGYADGVARAQAEVQQQLMLAVAALTDAQRERHDVAQGHEAALADLALKIARKVIGEHLDADPTLVARIVADTISELEPTTSLIVRVHPDDLAAVEADRGQIERLVKGTGKVEITADDTVDRGGVVLASPVGEVDARIETKLAVLETAFAAQRRQLIDGAGH
jgi:flagellar biosynthesis/type III secretory pathway protein FliH